MIALNKIIKDKDKFEAAYSAMGVTASLSQIVQLAQEFKALELESERTRAECNKLCSKVLSVRADPAKLSETMAEISRLDSLSNTLGKSAKLLETKINLELKKLHNMPDYIENSDKILAKNKNFANLDHFLSYLGKLHKVEHIDLSIAGYLRTLSGKLLDENQFPIITSCAKNEFVVLSSEKGTDAVLAQLISYFSENSECLIQLATNKLNKSASATYLAYIGNGAKVTLQYSHEYHSRDYKIKYHDSASDTTKFINEIRIKITKKR